MTTKTATEINEKQGVIVWQKRVLWTTQTTQH